MEYDCTSTFTVNKCNHQNGWYVYPTFLCFKKKYFVCSNCGNLIAKSKWYFD
jgi:hypothetical protein